MTSIQSLPRAELRGLDEPWHYVLTSQEPVRMTIDPLELEAVEDLALVPVEANLLVSVVGVPVDELPEPVFDSDDEVAEFIWWVHASRREAVG
jgi:hypothetical protein